MRRPFVTSHRRWPPDRTGPDWTGADRTLEDPQGL
ncbi:unnamed protein product [Anisakis simplex]|uniref:Uncharacterized protein n=1 Tax=Anisakis simplex TaxID=6269 RepID=A0A0M3JAM2_ANISI|nr:unnamed protein product [Anisakis simplex]